MSEPEPRDPYGGQPYFGGYPPQYPPAPPPPSSSTSPPAYPPASPSAYPPAYPPQYQPHQYQPYQQQYPHGGPYGYPFGPRRPGTVTASAVLAFVTAGLLIVAGLLLLAGASLVHDLGNDLNSNPNPATAELSIDGLLDLVAAGLLIAGGVMVNGRKPHGRTLLCVGGAIVIAGSVYWLARLGGASGSVVFYALLFAALVVIAIPMLFTGSARAWLDGPPPGKQPASPYR